MDVECFESRKERFSSTTFFDLLSRWATNEQQISKALTGEDTDDQSASSSKDMLELDYKQRQILEEIISTPTTTLEEVLAKLTVWKDIIAPHGLEGEWAQPSDKLVLSVILDLQSVICRSTDEV